MTKSTLRSKGKIYGGSTVKNGILIEARTRARLYYLTCNRPTHLHWGGGSVI